MNEPAGDKSFAPTPKRLRDAAKRGDVFRSRELATAAAMLVGAGVLLQAGPWLLGELAAVLRAGLSWDHDAIADFTPGQMMLRALLATLAPVVMIGAAVMTGTIAVQLIVSGEGRWVGSNLAIKGSRLDPLAGLKRMFGASGWIELAKSLAKLGLLGAIGWFWGAEHLDALVEWNRAALRGQLASGWKALITLLFALGIGLAMIALIDWPVQWLRRRMRLMMSQQDLRDEQKESEGSPERRMAQRERARQIAMGGVAHAMREAQFVLTNPSHFAVALAYDPAKAAAPLVLAKGRGDKALAMRELAAELAVPCLEYPALARSVYFTTRERQAIREELYAAIASVLAFVLSLKRGEHPAAPQVDVPVTLRFDSDGRLDASACT
jgi:flagellar biosynthetic protein FlhB